MQEELQHAAAMKASADELAQDLNDANKAVAKLETEVERHKTFAQSSRDQLKVCRAGWNEVCPRGSGALPAVALPRTAL